MVGSKGHSLLGSGCMKRMHFDLFHIVSHFRAFDILIVAIENEIKRGKGVTHPSYTP